MKLKAMFCVLWGVPAFALAVDTLVAQGWSTATLNDNGVQLNKVSAQGDSLPAWATCSASLARTVATLSSASSMRARDYGKKVEQKRYGSLELGYKLYTDANPTGKAGVRIQMDTKYALSAYLSVESTTGSASATARTDLVGKGTSIQQNSPGMNESSETGGQWRVGPKLTFVGKSASWNREADGRWSMPIRFDSGTLFDHTTAYHNTSGGTMLVIVANSSSSIELNGTAFTPYSVSTDPLLAGTAVNAAGLWTDFELFTSNNIQKQNFRMRIDDDGSFLMLMENLPNGVYKLYMKPAGALRKRTDIDYLSPGPRNLMPTFQWGDLDGDNVVSADDVNFVLAMVGKNSASIDWLDSADAAGRYAMQADLDHNGSVTLADYAMANANLGLVGD